MMMHKLKNIISLTISSLVLLASTSLATFYFPSGSTIDCLRTYQPTNQEGHAWNFALGFYRSLGDYEITSRSNPFRPLKRKFQVFQIIVGERPKRLSQYDALIRFRDEMEGLDEKLLNARFFQSSPDGFLELKIKGEATNEHLQGQPKMRYVNHEAHFKFSLDPSNGFVKLDEVTMVLGVERQSRVTEDLFQMLEQGIIFTG
ncbi:uncharacterized protein MELLADRAFT_65539 [Melampsora larici-populina 98AG31]|uniref:Secreted protein n=1 Tax=Melampsora larici-populina (strain 98AG31 / pathotype 3-4-7) TaxID=747676 RepID=F4RVT0_MELLP|nr:uncharacterized protein MELLADRAFT_65539 [Melampsora larici-populina 98AG31]EGG03530.1 secreted protein [Melampsora larici-populina 98AG31]